MRGINMQQIRKKKKKDKAAEMRINISYFIAQ
jgi:hypothetical protein